MIESCSTKRMLASIIFLGGLTCVVLVIESGWTESDIRSSSLPFLNTTNVNCWRYEHWEIVEPCHPCSDFEVTSQSNEACKETHYKEAVRCSKSGKFYRSCPKVSWIEEQKFWKFECIVFVASLIFTYAAFIRQKVLDQRVMMSGVYVSVSKADESFIYCDLDAAIVLFIYKYLECNSQTIPNLHLVINENQSGNFELHSTEFIYSSKLPDEIDQVLNNCVFPVYYRADEKYCVAGLCAVLRQLVKAFGNDGWLLGFRGACLSACAESSVWTKFCEVDLLTSTKQSVELTPEIPVDLVRLELHFEQPVRTHNIGKQNIRFSKVNGGSVEDGYVVEHCYVEGPEMLVSDLLILPLVHVFFRYYSAESVPKLLKSVSKWYNLMLSDERIRSSLCVLNVPENSIGDMSFIVPEVKRESLYKCDPRRYKAKEKMFTKQEDIDHVTSVIDAMNVLPEYEYVRREEQDFDWKPVPFHAHPKGGNLPAKRLDRKVQQIENIVRPVLMIAEDGDTIVDFCCGVGHVGILVAYFLPNCKIFLLDNKEHSLQRALDRIECLKLKNIFIIQSNIDYFKGTFDVGITLHACGVATDLVIKSCIENRSKFVIAPCCYGKLQVNHILQYPRSERYASSPLTLRDYMVAGHSADQTHKEEYSKSDQGEKCMRIVDVDRCLYAEECGYRVYLSKMVPPTCSPKNNFIVGVPREKYQERYFK